MKLAPKAIEPEDVGRFSIDDKNNLYWDGQLVHTESVLKLSHAQTLLARAVTIAALLASLATMANATASWLTYLRHAPPAPAITPATRSSAPSTGVEVAAPKP